MSWKKQLSRNIRETRQNAGLTQAMLAKAMKVEAGTVSHWETGYRVPTLAHLIKMSQVLNCSLLDLLEYE
jgi:transcriptional regulator with XRE-family HTH domain